MADVLSDKVALVTGGGSGIGRVVVEALVKEGTQVGVLKHSPENVEQAFNSDVGLGVRGTLRSPACCEG